MFRKDWKSLPSASELAYLEYREIRHLTQAKIKSLCMGIFKYHDTHEYNSGTMPYSDVGIVQLFNRVEELEDAWAELHKVKIKDREQRFPSMFKVSDMFRCQIP
jgi:hypothetical protein